jgi:NAD kinase
LSDLYDLRTRIAEQFQASFGRTALPQRVEDIVAQAAALNRADGDLDQLREEAGDLLSTLLQLCNENSWDIGDLVRTTLDKIAARTPPRSDETPAAPRATKVALFSSMFDPPSRYHREVAEKLLQMGFEEVVICPAGPRDGGREREHAPSADRAALVDLNFHDLPGVTVDLGDLDDCCSSDSAELEQRYKSGAEVWHVVSDEMVRNGCDGCSLIHQRWVRGSELWQQSGFVILHPSDQTPAETDLPPRHKLLAIDGHVPSAELRDRVYHGQSIDECVTPEVAAYIRRHRLFVPSVESGPTRCQIDEPLLLIEFDERNPAAQSLAAQYKQYASDQPNMILVLGGDGTMLRAIRRHWRKRLPILGLKAGHVGFLANERLPENLAGVELVVYSLPMLRVDAVRPSGEVVHGLAFGDAWIERDGGQAAWLRLEVDGQIRVPKIVGDGMLVASAAGSSAYARAMGAIPVPLTTPVFTLAGSNIFRPRFWKPMTLADDTTLGLVSLDHSGKRPVRGFLDGQPLGVIQSLTVQRSPIATVELAFTGEFDPSGKLLRSLFPPSEEE